MLKRAFISGGYTQPPPPTEPRDYYISEDGTGDGTTSGNPAPLSILTSAIENGQLISQDNIFFNRGDVFYVDELDIHNINNIDIDAFGSGASPILLGSTYIGNQTFVDNGDGTWYLSMASAPLWLTEGDVMLKKAETDWIPITVNVSAQVRRISTATLATLGNILGCEMYVKEFEFRLSQRLTPTIANAGTGDITFTGSLTGGDVGFPIKFVGEKQFITEDGEWAYDEVDQRLYIKSVATPTGRDLRIINSRRGIHVNNVNGFTIQNIEIKHYFEDPIFINQTVNATVSNCHLHSGRGNGVRAFGNSTTTLNINNCELDNLGMRGIELGAVQGASITENHIHDIGIQLSIGHPYDVNRTGGTAITLASAPTGYSWPLKLPNDILIDHNIIENIGYQGIQCIGSNWTITKNVIHDYCMKWSDGGGVHLYWNTAVNGATTGNLIQNNIIYNGIGNTDGITGFLVNIVAGCYFDSGITGNTFDSNVVWNGGVYAFWANDHNDGHVITNNIFHGMVWLRQNTTVSSSFPINNVTNCVFTGNTIAVDLSTERCLVLWNQSGGNWSPFTAGIDNNHYVNPYNVQGNINATTTNGFSFGNYTIAGWRTFVSGDANSTSRFNYKTTPDADDILINDNPSDTSESFNVPVGYVDHSGNSFSNPVSIPAWYGLIYFQS